jgi:hypothetical protein
MDLARNCPAGGGRGGRGARAPPAARRCEAPAAGVCMGGAGHTAGAAGAGEHAWCTAVP